MEVQARSGFDEWVGRNIQEMRTARGMSQTELADRADRLGVPLRQQTVVKIEQGQRPLRLLEADVLAEVLGVDIDVLVDPDRKAFDQSRQLVLLLSRLSDAHEAIADRVAEYEELRWVLGVALEHAASAAASRLVTDARDAHRWTARDVAEYAQADYEMRDKLRKELGQRFGKPVETDHEAD